MNKWLLMLVAAAALCGLILLLGWQATLILLIIFAVFAAAIARRSRVAPSCCGGGDVDAPPDNSETPTTTTARSTPSDKGEFVMNQADIHLKVANMSCDGCVKSIRERLEPLAGADNVQVTLRDRSVILHGGLDAQQAIAELDKIGFKAEQA